MGEVLTQTGEYLSLTQAAKKLKVSPSHLHRLMKKGKLDLLPLRAGPFRFVTVESVERLRLDRQENPPKRGRPAKERGDGNA